MYTYRPISIHSLRVEGDFWYPDRHISSTRFQSTPSVWRETRCCFLPAHCRKQFQSTPSVWRETKRHIDLIVFVAISIHSLRVEGDIAVQIGHAAVSLFQSTPSVWRETLQVKDTAGTVIISIHSLRVEGDCTFVPAPIFSVISIHSLRVGGDEWISGTDVNYMISIHSLRVEGD